MEGFALLVLHAGVSLLFAAPSSGRLFYFGVSLNPAVRQLLMGARRLPTYIGQIATHCFIPVALAASNKQMMNRSSHTCLDHVSRVQLAFACWQNEEATIGGNATITASVEYPAGTFTQATFSGAASGTITDGSFVLTDWINVSIPKDARFWVRSYFTNAAGICYRGASTISTNGDAMTFGASGIADQTMGGTVVNTSAGVWYGPALILGQTTAPSFLCLGDSRVAGQGDSNGAGVEVGELARSLSSYALSNFGVPGAKAQVMATQGPTGKRAQLGQFFSHVISNFSINDLRTPRTAAQLLADVQTIRWFFPSARKFYQATISPDATSTDSFATTANQTPSATSNTQRLAFNNLVRATPIGIAGYIEIADQVESARDSGVWKAPGYTSDGLHATSTGYAAIQSAGVMPAQLFR